MQSKVLSGIQTFKDIVAAVEAKRATLNQQEIEDFSDQMQIMRTLEAEVYCMRLEWDKLLLVVEVRRYITYRHQNRSSIYSTGKWSSSRKSSDL